MKMQVGPAPDNIARYADMFRALGSESRLRVVRLLLSAHPQGLVVGEIQKALGTSPSTLSHHLERLRHVRLVTVKRESTFLRYSVNAPVLQDLLSFLVSECCSRNRAVRPDVVLEICRGC
ncbi:MAG: metalloregulator ArsR/SmtB family transcription factor [Bryobacterales bacterium]|nr:metalloregulator ArsR/SmtB family transcription factor [Bryobacterales bacterium]